MLSSAINTHTPYVYSQLHISSSFQQSTTLYSSQSSESSERFSGFRVFEALLNKGYEALKTGNTQSLPTAASGEALSASKVANNILGFIERRLMLDAAEGATEEELNSRLEAGLEGFKKGFSQAQEQLQGLGLLSDAVANDINETYERVLGGIESLREKYLDANKPLDDELANEDTGSVTPQASSSTSLQGFSQYSYAQRNTFSFELETTDGDKVVIQASAQEAFVLEQRAYSGQYNNSSQFNLRVKGELDEGELSAINDLLAQVNQLSDQFFSGNVEEAFNEALNVGYDSGEIAGFALNLTRTEVERVSSAYQQSRSPESLPAPTLADRLQPVGQFAKGLLDAVDLASAFSQPHDLIKNLADHVSKHEGREESSPGKEIVPFINRLFDTDLFDDLV